ncbi:hypothetical protein [Pedobacter nyackensis]|uniref:hypothetical protein n=1 Tax=Pedobacter nyackensis TaxID=475255 RepID=UPI00292E3BEF|nr:hypothetical protein [Pedobacter nyackensis]
MKKFYHISLDLHFSALVAKWTAFVLFVVFFCFAYAESNEEREERVVGQLVASVVKNKVLFDGHIGVERYVENSSVGFDIVQLAKG